MNDYKVMEIQKQKQMSKAIRKDKQRAFKEYLDKQVGKKNEQR